MEPIVTRSVGWCPHGGSTEVTGVYRGSAAGSPSAWTWLACAILLRARLGRSEGNAGCPCIPENFMKKLNRRVPPPWGDDMEEALRAQYEVPSPATMAVYR